MANIGAIEDALNALRAQNEDVIDATVISRSGMHIAGNVPPDAHIETYVAMNAIILGAAESASSEVKDKLEFIVVNMKHCKLLIFDVGARALMAVRTRSNASIAPLIEDINAYREKIESNL
ncbi:MAG: hypothetical protein DRN20_02170 [Thermoplasmata archaeon]|nr:MAG: hypothetical protein DRN20_02170 [Thermoplasmata archaeon]